MRRPWDHLPCAVVVLLVTLAFGCAPLDGPRDVIVWVSIDGLRPDYVTAGDAPFLRGLLERSPHTSELVPPFPSLTFPSHVTQATGVGVASHGITGNGFWDSSVGRSFDFPDESSLIEAEPIWKTATRQGRRVAVLGWPLSYRQEGPNCAAYFDERFEKDGTDAQRLDHVIDVWRADRESHPLTLIMSYAVGVDGDGHKFGPASSEVRRKMRETDDLLARFFEKARSTFAEKMASQDRLHVLFTTDHGMAPVHTLVDFDALVGRQLPPEAHVERGSTLVHFFLDRVPSDRRPALEEEILQALAPHSFVVAYRRSQLPARWQFAHPTRVGDVVVELKPGFAFGKKLAKPLMTPEEADGVRGMHGYDPDDSPDMLGLAILWSSRGDASADLGRVDARRLHPTIARLLGIEPASLATAKPLDLGASAR